MCSRATTGMMSFVWRVACWVACWVVMLAPVSGVCRAADFQNGGFDNGINHWTVEYGSVLGNCTQATGGWQATAFGHDTPTTIALYKDYERTIAPYCGGEMLQLTSNAYKQTLKATRIFQETTIDSGDLQGTCGAVRISAKYLLAMTTGEAHSKDIATEAFFRIEILKNGSVIETRTMTPHRPFQPPWWNPTGPVYAIEGAYETVVRSLVVNDKIAIRMTMGQCCDTGGHGGVAYVDCVSLTPAPDAFAAPTVWGNQAAREWRVGDFDGNGQDDLLDWSGTAQIARASGPAFLALAPWSFVPLSNQGRGTVGDFNGDGRDDILDYRPSTGAFVHFSTGGGFSTGQVAWAGPQPGSGRVYSGDFDGDGRADMLFQIQGAVPRIYRSTGTTFGSVETGWTTQTTNFGVWYIGDFNGDAKSDLGRWSAAGGFEVMLSTGVNFRPPQVWTRHGPLYSGIWRIGDFDCDGRDDLMRDSPGAFTNATVEVLRSTGTQFVKPVAWYATINRGGLSSKLPLIPGDFDGNGSDDLEAGSANVYRSCASCACMVVHDKGAACDPNNATQRVWTFAVRNGTTQPVTSVRVTPVSGFAILSGTVNLSTPLLPGYWRTVSVVVSGVGPGSYCATVALRNASDAVVCSNQVCFKAGDCACSGILIDALDCTTDGSGDVLMTFRLKNTSGFAAASLSLQGTAPAGMTLSPSTFSLSLAQGATSAPLVTRVGGVGASGSICFDWTMVYLRPEGDIGLCPGRTCIDIPTCPGTPGWCCTPQSGCISVPHLLACQQASGTFSTNYSICPTCPGPAWFPVRSGVTTNAMGSALLNVSADGWLNLSGIGSTGEDGIDIDFRPVLRGEMALAPIDPLGELLPGSSLRAAIRGKVNGIGGSEIGSVRVLKDTDAFLVEAEFAGIGAALHDVEMYQDGVLVGVHGARSGPFSSTAWPDGVGAIKQDVEGLVHAGVLLRWQGGAIVTIDGVPTNVNEVRVLAGNAQANLASVSGMTITGVNLPQVEFASADTTPDYAARCLADLNADAFVDDMDFVLFLPAYEVLVCEDDLMPDQCAADFNRDGVVDDDDFVIFLGEYNRLACP